MDREDACGEYTVRYEPCSDGCVHYWINCGNKFGNPPPADYITCVAMSECEYAEKVSRGVGIFMGSLLGGIALCVLFGVLYSCYCSKEDEEKEGDNYTKA